MLSYMPGALPGAPQVLPLAGNGDPTKTVLLVGQSKETTPIL